MLLTPIQCAWIMDKNNKQIYYPWTGGFLWWFTLTTNQITSLSLFLRNAICAFPHRFHNTIPRWQRTLQPSRMSWEAGCPCWSGGVTRCHVAVTVQTWAIGFDLIPDTGQERLDQRASVGRHEREVQDRVRRRVDRPHQHVDFLKEEQTRKT